jgi:ankyrin repeat protein
MMRCFAALLLALSTLGSVGQAASYDDFFLAIENDRAAEVQTLLQRGFDPNSRDEKGQVGLFLASRSGSLKVAQALLADPRTEVDATNDANETPLMMAAMRDQVDLAAQMLARGASVNRVGWTPLHYAASGAGSATLALLLARGAAVDSRSSNGSTALMLACRYGSEAAVDLLIAHGADTRSRNERQLNAADFARSAGRDYLVGRLDRAAVKP